MTKRIVQALVGFLIIAFLSMPALGASETIDIFGTNASNAQTNMTKSGNQSVNVSIWTNELITFTINVTNTTDTFAITLHNRTIGRLIEWRFNGSIANATQADSTGTIRFTQIQGTGNRTYSLQPAVNYGGYNFTWGWFKEWIWIGGKNLSSIITDQITSYNYLPLSGTTTDLDMNQRNITNVRTINSTTVNVTTLNATNIEGNGSRISNLNATNITTGVLPNASIPLSAANRSSTNVFTGNVDVKGDRLLVEYPSTTHNIMLLPGTTGGYHTIRSDYGSGAGYLPLRLTADPGSYLTQLVLDTNGNIGIGNTTPGYDLVIGTNPWSGINAGDSVFTTSSNLLINVTQNYTIGATNSTGMLYTCHANSGTLNITLPTGVAGREFTIKKKDATGNVCSVFSGQNIDGARYANISAQYNSIDVVFTSDEWSII